jgi:cyanate permease
VARSKTLQHLIRSRCVTTCLQQRSFWGAALGHFCANYACYFLITWLPTFLVKAGGLSVAQMATVGATIYGVYAASTAPVGAAADYLIRKGFSTTVIRKSCTLIGALGTAITILGSAYVDPDHAAWLLGLSGVFAGFVTPMIFTIATTLAGPRAAGRWVGAQNLIGQCAGILEPLITGFMVQATGNFSGAFVFSAAIALLGMVGWGLVIRKIAPVSWAESPTVWAT